MDHPGTTLTPSWLQPQKLAAVGVGAKRWVTFHGVALNVVPNLTPFGAIVPCGIGDKPVGSVATVLAGSPGFLSTSFPVGGGIGDDPRGTGKADVGVGRVGVAQVDQASTSSSSWAWPTTTTSAESRLLEEYRWALRDGAEEVLGVTLVDWEEAIADGVSTGIDEDLVTQLVDQSVPDPWTSQV